MAVELNHLAKKGAQSMRTLWLFARLHISSLRLSKLKIVLYALVLFVLLPMLTFLSTPSAHAENRPAGTLAGSPVFKFDCNRALFGFTLEDSRNGIKLYVSRRGAEKAFAVRDQRGCTFEVTAESAEFIDYFKFGIDYVELPTGEVGQDLALEEPLREELLSRAFAKCEKSHLRLKTYSGREPSGTENKSVCHGYEVGRLLLKGSVVAIYAPRKAEKCRNPYFYLDTFEGTIYSIQQPCDMKKTSTIEVEGKQNGG